MTIARQLILEYQNKMNNRITNDFVLKKTNNSYMFMDKKETVSKLKYYDYGIKDFDWVLICDIDTKSDYRNMGLASKLIDEVYKDITKDNPNKGIYLFVRIDNYTAIKLYKKLKFKTIKKYTLKDGDYFIMAKGNADVSQFNNMNFA